MSRRSFLYFLLYLLLCARNRKPSPWKGPVAFHNLRESGTEREGEKEGEGVKEGEGRVYALARWIFGSAWNVYEVK